MRHAVNKAVSVSCKTHSGNFDKFKELHSDPKFLAKLHEAKRNPTSADSMALLSMILSFTKISAVHVPWGSQERQSEIGGFIGHHREVGAGSVFVTIAPDDVHNPDTIRYCAPYEGPDVYPAVIPPRWLSALQGSDDDERIVYDDDGVLEYDMSEARLQLLAASNPVACALIFNRTIENVRATLLRVNKKRKCDVPMPERRKGIFGLAVRNKDVKETNNRGAFHSHGLHHGGCTPALLAEIADDNVLCTHALKGLDSQLCAELPLEFHRIAIANKLLKVAKRRDAAFSFPTPPPNLKHNLHSGKLSSISNDLDDWFRDFKEHTMLIVANRHVHEHAFTCTKGARGKCGCRMRYGMPHNIPTTRCVQLHLDRHQPIANNSECVVCDPIDELDGATEQSELCRPFAFVDEYPMQCSHCYGRPQCTEGMSVNDLMRARTAEDKRRELHRISSSVPLPRSSSGPDDRVLALDVKRGRIILETGLRASYEEAIHNLDEDVKKQRLQEMLAEMISPETKLGRLLQRPDLSKLNGALHKLLCDQNSLQCAAAIRNAPGIATTSTGLLQMLLDAWSAPSLQCLNSMVVDFSTVLTGCTHGNAACYALGAGHGSQNVSMYMIKYMWVKTPCVLRRVYLSSWRCDKPNKSAYQSLRTMAQKNVLPRDFVRVSSIKG